MTTVRVIRWNGDGVDGGPSSVDVLLEWLERPGNAPRWLAAPSRKDGSRVHLAAEIHDLLLSYGITHRTHHAIVDKFWYFEQQLGKVETWLQARGLQPFELDEQAERAVLQLCPYYRQLAPLLRPSWFQRSDLWNSEVGVSRNVGFETSDDESDDAPKRFGAPRRSQKVEYAFNHAALVRWDSDGEDGKPSSLDVLLEWLVAPGNAERWCAASIKRDGSQMALASEVYDLLLVHSITYRSRAAVIRKLHWLEEQFDRAEGWLKRTGIQDFNDSSESEDMLLSMYPVYPTIAHVLRSARRSVANTSSQASRNTSVGASFRQATQKSAAARTKRSYPKRPSSHPQLDSVGAKGVAILKAEPEERREFFKLELQVKRDQAICVRAKARKELFDMGMSPEDVDRLLPL